MIWIVGLLAFGFTRLYQLDLIPIFADEAIYVRWAQLLAYDWRHLFVPLTDGKTPLFMWLLAPFLRLGLDPLITGRILSAVSGLGTVTGIYFLTKKLFEEKTARLAAGLALIQPFMLFYDRMSLTDSLLTSLIVWAVYFGTGAGLGLTAAAALLVKPSALIYLLLIPLFNLKAWREHLKAGAIAFIIYNGLRFSDSFYMIKQRSLDYLQGPTLQHWSNTVKVFSGWLLSYLDWPFLLILVLSLIIAAKFREKKIAVLSLFVVLPFLVQAAIGKVVYPRYLLPMVPFILIISAWGLNRLPKVLKTAFILLILTGWLSFDYYLLTDPVKAPLHLAEKEQYFYDWSAGYGLKEIRQYLLALPTDQKAVVATEGSFGTLPNGLEIYFSGHPTIQILGVGFPSGLSPGMEQVLAEGKRLFLVANKDRFTFPPESRLKLIAEYPRPRGATVPSEVEGERLLFYEVY